MLRNIWKIFRYRNDDTTSVIHTKRSQNHTITEWQTYEFLVYFFQEVWKPRKIVSAQSEKVTVCSDTMKLSFRTYLKKNINMGHYWNNKKPIYINNYVGNFRLISDLWSMSCIYKYKTSQHSLLNGVMQVFLYVRLLSEHLYGFVLMNQKKWYTHQY